MRAKITKRTVDALQPGEADAFLWDTEVSGFGLKVTRAGLRTYLLQYRLGGRGAPTRRFTIGRHGSPWTPDAARAEAVRLLGRVAAGEDPQETKRAEKADPTFAEFADRYLAEHARPHKKPRSVELDEYMLRQHILPVLGRKQLGRITQADAAGLHAGLREKSTIANRVVTLVATMFVLAGRWGVVPSGTNPCRHVTKYKERKRDRFLSEAELARLGEALVEVEVAGTSPPMAIAALRLLILTGARKTEVLTLRWAYVDFQRGLLRLPDSKTGAKVIYLSAPALELLATLRRIEGNPHVLPGDKVGAHLVNVEKTWRRVRALAGLDEVRIHDLRHSFAAVGAGSGLGLPIIGALLGHTQASTTQRYAHLAADPLRAANEAIGARIAAAMKGSGGAEVTELRKKG